MTHLTSCPLCQNTSLFEYLSCKDYTVSHETFQLQKCSDCGFVFTNPRPDDETLGTYYQSINYVSHSDQAHSPVDRLYRVARSLALRWKFDLIRKYALIPPKFILDFGCGTGSFLRYCKRKNVAIAGVEPASNARTAAEKNTGENILSSLAEVKGTYDIITLWHVLEHVPDLHNTVQQLSSLLKKSGTMFIAVPNLNSADASKYRAHWAAYDVPRHIWHFSKNTMTQLLNDHNLKVKGILPMPLDTYYVSLLSEKYKRDKMSVGGILQAIVSALKSNRAAKRTKESSSLIYIVRK